MTALRLAAKMANEASKTLWVGRWTFHAGRALSHRWVLSMMRCLHRTEGSQLSPDASADGGPVFFPGGARPILFQRSPPPSSSADGTTPSGLVPVSSPLTPYDLRGTVSMLPPKWMHLSPCFGAALSTSPLLGNLMRLGRYRPFVPSKHSSDNVVGDSNSDSGGDTILAACLSEASFLANSLFFQMIRESPIHVGRNKSMPASYLTPALVGTFLSHSVGGHPPHHNRHDAVRHALRDDFGIKSNRIHEHHWTGISLARWMDLVVEVPSQETSLDRHRIQSVLVPSLWLIALWGVASSKGDLARYYEVIDRCLLQHQHRGDQSSLKWGLDGSTVGCGGGIPTSSLCFTEADFGKTQLEDAMDRVLHYYRQTRTSRNLSCGDNVDNDHVARAIELICASLVLRQDPLSRHCPNVSSHGHALDAIPNGCYNYDGGDYKADCVEVVIREIVQYLFYDPVSGMWDESRLPPTASHRLRELIRMEGREQQQDSRGRPGKPSTSNDGREREVGQAWFDMLSDLPGCDYLAISPGGKRFELAPTIESISKALWHLLVAGGSGPSFGEVGASLKTRKRRQGRIQEPWTSLDDLARFLLLSSTGTDTPPQRLCVLQDRLRHMQSSSDGDISTNTVIEHEIVTLQLEGSPRVIEIRLRCDMKERSGMAVVTHLAEPRQDLLMDPEQVQQLHDLYYSGRGGGGKIDAKTGLWERCDPSFAMLCLALPQNEHGNNDRRIADPSNVEAMRLCLSWLATPYGPDRREVRIYDRSNTYVHGCSDKVEVDESVRQLNQEGLFRNKQLLKDRILQACRLIESHPTSGLNMLVWILKESPIVIESSCTAAASSIRDTDSDVERALLSLPIQLLEDESMQNAIQWNWACRGRPLVLLINWRLGKLSLSNLLLQSSISELLDIASMMRSDKGRE